MKRRVSVWQSVVTIFVVVIALAATYAIQWQKPVSTLVVGEVGTRKGALARNAQMDRIEQAGLKAAQQRAPAAKK